MTVSTLPATQLENNQDAEDEELEEVPDVEKAKDPFMGAKIMRPVSGTDFPGRIEDVEQGKITKERLYRVRYDDGDLEHLTFAQVDEFKVAIVVTKAAPKAKAKLQGEVNEKIMKNDDISVLKRPATPDAELEDEAFAEEDVGDGAGEKTPIMKKPAFAKAVEEKTVEADEMDDVVIEQTPVIKKPAFAKAAEDKTVDDDEDADAEAEDEEDEEEEKPLMKKPAFAKVPTVTAPKGKSTPVQKEITKGRTSTASAQDAPKAKGAVKPQAVIKRPAGR